MNLKELRNRLGQLSDLKFGKFVQDFGGSFQDREEVVSAFVGKPELERRLCQLLDIATEEEKMVQATLAAASSAKWSAIVAAIATAIALIALVVTIYGVLK
jgi:hypothetical protein